MRQSRPVRSASSLVAGLCLLLGVPAGAAALAHGAAPAEPTRLLTAPAHGAAAVTRLGAALDLAASRSRLPAQTLSEVLEGDHTAWVDGAGQLFFADALADSAGATGPETSAATYPYDQTFRLHSRPTATRVVYLDFDGYALHDTAWNASGTPALTVPPYSKDADPSFSAAELDVVQEVWARVAEDYAPFNIDVTTEDPGTSGIARTSAEDAAYGSRVSITADTSLRSTIIGCGGGCAGVAYVGTYDMVLSGYPEYYQPAFALGAPSYTAANFAEIASHEVGHHLGLLHDGEGISSYYRDMDGTRIWSPVMGAAYTPLTQFSNGDYSAATQTQDDYAVMGQRGPTLVGDDYGNGRVTAYPLGGAGATASGLIGTRSDLDVFQVTRSCTGSLIATVTPAPLGPDLDSRLRLLDASGAVLAVASPAAARGGTWSPVVTGLGASLTQALDPGTYYLEVDGVGLDHATQGYSDYGSVGRYSMSVSGCAGATPSATAPSVPVLVAAERDSAAHGLRLVWEAPAATGGTPITSYVVTVNGGSPVTLGAGARSTTIFNLDPQTSYTLGVAALNAAGTSPVATRAVVTGSFSGGPVSSPPTSAPTSGPTSAPTSAPTSGPTSGPTSSPTSTPTSSPTATPTAGPTAKPTVAPTTSPTALPLVSVPAAPVLARVRPGRPGGATTIRLTWRSPFSTGGAPLTAYDVAIWRVDARGRLHRQGSYLVRAADHSLTLRLAAGKYRFAVSAANYVGTGPRSARSDPVRAR